MRCSVNARQRQSLIQFACHQSPDELPPELRSISEHVADCEHCQQQIASLSDQLFPAPWLSDAPLAWPDDYSLPQDQIDSLKQIHQQTFVPQLSVAPVPEDVELSRLLDPALEAGELGRVDDYRVQAVLGRGGMALVVAAWDPQLQRQVAIKILASGHSDSIAGQRFVREARAVAAIDHPNVIAIHEVIQRENQPSAIVMPMMSGGTLGQRLSRGPLGLREAVEIARQIASALAAAHEAGLVHRDIKPANILFDGNQNAVLADFGLVRDQESSLTAEDVIPGTPEYLCPEQIATGESTPLSDVYQLGMTLYASVTGRPAFQGECAQVLHKITTQWPTRPRKLRSQVDRDLETILVTALEKEPEHRYPSAEAMHGDLTAWLDGRPVSVVRRGMLSRAAFWCRKHRVAASLLGTVPLAVLMLVVGLLILWRSRDSVRERLDAASLRAEQLQASKVAAEKNADLMRSRALRSVIESRAVQMPNRRPVDQKLLLTLARTFEVQLSRALEEPGSDSKVGTTAQAVATLYARGGNPAKALPLFEVALERLGRQRTPEMLDDLGFVRQLATCHRDAAATCMMLGEAERAHELGSQASDLYAVMRMATPEDVGAIVDHALAKTIVVESHRQRGHQQAAREAISVTAAELASLSEAVKAARTAPNMHSNYVQVCGEAAGVLEKLGETESALTLRSLAVEHWQEYRRDQSTAKGRKLRHEEQHAAALIALGWLHRRLSRVADAEHCATTAIDVLNGIPERYQAANTAREERRRAQQLLHAVQTDSTLD